MSVGTMIFLGLLVGFVANKFVMRRGEGMLRDLGLASAGAVLAGGALRMLASPTQIGFSASGAVAALVGAAAVVYLYHSFHPHVSAR